MAEHAPRQGPYTRGVLLLLRGRAGGRAVVTSGRTIFFAHSHAPRVADLRGTAHPGAARRVFPRVLPRRAPPGTVNVVLSRRAGRSPAHYANAVSRKTNALATPAAPAPASRPGSQRFSGMARSSATVAATGIAAIATTLVGLPIIIARIGVSLYGIWALGQLVVTYTAAMGAGISPALQRFAAVAQGAGDDAVLSELVWTATAVYAALALVIILAAWFAAPDIVALFSVPSPSEHDAATMMRLVGVAASLSLYAGGLQSIHNGVGRYSVSATASITAAVSYLIAMTVWLTGRHDALRVLALSLILGQLLAVITHLAFLGPRISPYPVRVITGVYAREFFAFSGRLQFLPLTDLIVTQSDRLVLGMISTAATVGYFAVGSQVAAAVVLLAMSILVPLTSQFATWHGEGMREHVFVAQLLVVQKQWTRSVCGIAVILCAFLPALLLDWLGIRTGAALTFACITVAAYSLNLLTGPITAYLRAVGRPSLEARYGLSLIVTNVVATVILGLLVGPYGVVLGTLVSFAGASVWLFVSFMREVPPMGRLLFTNASCSLAWAVPLAALGGEVAWRLSMTTDGLLGLAASGTLLVATTALYLQLASVLNWRTLIGRRRARSR